MRQAREWWIHKWRGQLVKDTERESMGPLLEEQTVEEEVVGVIEREPLDVSQGAVLIEGEVVDT